MQTARLYVFLAFICVPAFGAPLSLERALNELHNESPKIAKSESVAREAGDKRSETLSVFLPTINLGATHLMDEKYVFTDINFGGSLVSVPAILPFTAFTLDARLPLFDGFASFSQYAAAGSNEDAAKLESNWTRFSAERELILQFYRAMGAKLLEDVAQKNLAMLEDHMREAKLMKQAGVSTNYDLLRVDVQVSEARSELLNASDNAAIARTRLGELLGHAGEDRDLVGKMPVPEARVVNAVMADQSYVQERADIQALDLRHTARTEQQSAANKFWVPKFYLFGQLQYYNNRTGDLNSWDQYRNAYQVGLGLSWNIFDGLSSLSRYRQSVEQSIQAEKNLVMAELHGRQDIELWKRKFLYFCEVYRARVDDVEKATESVRLAKEGRRVGSRTTTDLLDAENELFRARAGVVNAQIGAIEAIVNLELATGRTLYAFEE